MGIFISFCLSYLICFTLTPPFRKFFAKRKIFDHPNFRSQHFNPIVRTGGIAIFISFIFTFIICLPLGLINLNESVQLSNILLIVICSLLFFLIGLIDDLVLLSPFLRLGIQFSSASLLWIFNIKISVINLFWIENLELPHFLSYLITVFWVVGITNAINWLDGLDGLIAGIILIYTIGLISASGTIEQNNLTIISSIIGGVCLAFLKYNSYPAKIIMGDGGSNFLGFIISILSLYPSESSAFNGIINANFTLGILALPLLDMIYVIFRRISNNNSPFFPDRNHFHHRLIKAGFSERNAVLFIYLIVIINTFAVTIFL